VPILRFFAVALAGYAALAGAMYFGQRRLLYFPDPTLPKPASWGVPEMTAVQVDTADGLSLLAWYRPPADNDKPTLAFFHGNAGHIGYRGGKMRPYLDAGFGVLLLAWRGYSGNPGSPTEEGLYHDGRAALSFLAQAGGPPSRIVLYGESLGSAVAVQLATEQSVAAVVLEAPFTSTADVAASHYWFMPVQYMVLDRFETKGKIARVGAPLFIIHGEEDRVVPADHGRALFAAASEPKEARFIPAAGHNDIYEFGAADAVIDFLDRMLD
jgi:hypothetical protein